MKIYQHFIAAFFLAAFFSSAYACMPAELMTLSISSNTENSFSLFSVDPQVNDNLSALAMKLRSLGVDLEKYKKAILGNESGGRPSIVNPHSGALGLYQFMPSTLRGLGYNGGRGEFLANREVQEYYMDRLIESNLNQVLKVYGNDSTKILPALASMHYSGSPTKWETSIGAQVYGRGTYPSIRNYAADIIKRYKAQG